MHQKQAFWEAARKTHRGRKPSTDTAPPRYYVSRCNDYHLSEASDLLTLSSVGFQRRNKSSGHRLQPLISRSQRQKTTRSRITKHFPLPVRQRGQKRITCLASCYRHPHWQTGDSTPGTFALNKKPLSLIFPVRTSVLTVACAALNLLRRNTSSSVGAWSAGCLSARVRLCKLLPSLFPGPLLILPRCHAIRVFILLSI